MRIVDASSDKTLNNVYLFLELEEAKDLCHTLKVLIERNDPLSHEHVDDRCYEHELTISIYNKDDISMLSDRVQEIIKYDR